MSNNPLITKFEKLVKDLNTIIFGDDDQDVILDDIVKPTISKWLRSIVTDLNAAIDIAAAAGAGANGWTAQLIADASGKNQQEINDGLESISELMSISSPSNGARFFVKGLQGGWFEYNVSKAHINDGVITFNGWERHWDRLNVQPEWAGAKGDGLADDTIALQSALDFISSSAWDTSVAVMNQKGGGLNLILSANKYRITKTLWVGAYTTIRGSGMLGFNSAKSQETSSIIYADLDDVNTAAVSSSNWKTGGVRLPFNNVSSGAVYDNGLVSATHGLKLYDFSIIASKKTHIGLRVQNSPQSRIEIYVHGFDYGVLMNASWQSYVNCRTLSYKCGLLLLNDNNGIKFDGYYNALGGDPLNYHNFINFFGADTDIDSNWNDSNTKFGVVSRYSYGLCSDSTVAEHNSVGIVIANGDASIQTLYTEANSIVGLGCYTSAVTIDDWVGYGDGYDMLIGANGKLYVNGITKDNLNTGIKGFSRWNSVLSMPVNYNYYVRGIKYHGTENVIHVSASGSDTNNGVYQPLLTLDEALNRIKNTHDLRDKTITTPNKQSWIIRIISEGVYPIIKRHLIACDVEIISTLVNKPTITVEGGDNNAIVLAGSNFTLTGCNLTKGVTAGVVENAIFWSTTGENTVSMSSGTLTLGEGSFVYPSWNGGSILNIALYDVSIVGSATTMLTSSNYLNASPHIVNFICSQSSVDINITGRADKGIAVPSTWQGKVLGF